jgi:hypothetical protein
MPNPRAERSRPKPAEPPPSTWRENTSPRGTTMPPPIKPVLSETMTARTVGVENMKCQPSRTSRKALEKSMRTRTRANDPTWSVRFEMSPRVEMRAAEPTKVSRSK